MPIRFCAILFLAAFGAGAQIINDQIDRDHCREVYVQQNGQELRNPLLHFQNESGDFFLQRKLGESGLQYQLSGAQGETWLKARKVRDFFVHENKLWTVGSDGLQVWKETSGELIASYPISARAMELDAQNNLAFLASGSKGLAAFDLANARLLSIDPLNTRNDNGHRSAAVSVVKSEEGLLYIAMTGNSEDGFNGVLVYDPVTKTILNKAEYNERRAGVVFPFASIYAREGMVYLNNGGWIHSFDTDTLKRKRKVMPRWLAIEHRHDNWRSYVMMQGDLFFSGGKVMGCGSFMDHNQNQLKARLFGKELP